MFAIHVYSFQQTSPHSVDKDPGNLDPNIPDKPEDRVKEDGDSGTSDDQSGVLKAQLFNSHLQRLWRTGALINMYRSDEDCDTFEVSLTCSYYCRSVIMYTLDFFM